MTLTLVSDGASSAVAARDRYSNAGTIWFSMSHSGEGPQQQVASSRRRAFVAVAVAAASMDLISKLAASRWLRDRAIDLPGPLDLRLGHNPGVAFGLGNAAPPWLMVTLTALVAAGIAVAGWRGKFASMIGVGLVVGGAVANVIDRSEAGSVVDMLYLGWWPTFNLADVWITTGVGLLMLGELRNRSLTTEGRMSEPSDSELVCPDNAAQLP